MTASLEDRELLAHFASEAGIVTNAVESSDYSCTDAILRGIKRRWRAKGGSAPGTLVHFSDTSISLDGSREGRFDDCAKEWTVRLVRSVSAYVKLNGLR